MRPPLWLNMKYGSGNLLTLSLAKCRNCGEVKVASEPCGFDHLAAVLEFNTYAATRRRVDK